MTLRVSRRRLRSSPGPAGTKAMSAPTMLMNGELRALAPIVDVAPKFPPVGCPVGPGTCTELSVADVYSGRQWRSIDTRCGINRPMKAEGSNPATSLGRQPDRTQSQRASPGTSEAGLRGQRLEVLGRGDPAGQPATEGGVADLVGG
jgi:hypothetical protein